MDFWSAMYQLTCYGCDDNQRIPLLDKAAQFGCSNHEGIHVIALWEHGHLTFTVILASVEA